MSSQSFNSAITIEDFGTLFLVVCPRCEKQAIVQPRSDSPLFFATLTCSFCGLARTWQIIQASVLYSQSIENYQAGAIAIGAPVDWYFHVPLWLQLPCCGHVLWAYNAEHLMFLETFVSAKLRSSARTSTGWSNRSLHSRLPRWMQIAKNRETILHAINKLNQKL